MSTSRDLRLGVADELKTAGIAEYRLNFNGYTGTRIYLSKMPSDPDRVLVVTTYPRPAPHEHGVQVRCRGAKGGNVSAEDLADDVRTALHGLSGRVWGDTEVELLAFVSAARMGFDSSDRDEVALNFRAVTSDPSTALID